MKKNIGIIGAGYVGQAFFNLFKNHYNVLLYDVDSSKCLRCSRIEEINDCCYLSVVCVPTPMKDGTLECNISIVEDVINKLNTPLILLKSTVEIGTTEMLKKKYNKRIVFSPEYCGESSYWTPYKFHTEVVETPFFVFGGDKKDTSEMVDYFLPICGPTKKYYQTDSRTAEVVKYAENTFYTTKIAFCYELFEICKIVGIDFNEVRELWLADPRINPMHTSVFEKNDFPFSGKCLPKDLNGLIKLAEKKGYEPKLLKEVWESNKRISEIRKKRRDEDNKEN